MGARAHQAARSARVIAGMAIHRAELDVLEARLRVSYPNLAWLDGMRAFKAEADAYLSNRAEWEGAWGRLPEKLTIGWEFQSSAHQWNGRQENRNTGKPSRPWPS